LLAPSRKKEEGSEGKKKSSLLKDRPAARRAREDSRSTRKRTCSATPGKKEERLLYEVPLHRGGGDRDVGGMAQYNESKPLLP